MVPKLLADLRMLCFMDEGPEHGILLFMYPSLPVLQPGIQVGEIVGNGGIEQTSWSHLFIRLEATSRSQPADSSTKLLKNLKERTLGVVQG